ncbi:hypothetical protein [Dactylosporangium sp. NPDC049140]|uniref:hypothetical protein n=1 Tax=Dactylosporangium sp. NPDC049140 TaxID=3155647 RepID=UPI0033FF814C
MHPFDDLPEYATGARVDAGVAAHVAGCARCTVEVAGWRALAAMAGPVPDVVAAALLADRPRVAAGRRWLLSVRLAAAQLRLIPAAAWLVCALGMAGAALAAVRLPGSAPLVFPLVLAAGVATVAEPGPADELIRATATSARLVFAVRVALVVAFDVLVALPVPGLLGAAGAGAALLAALALVAAVHRDAGAALVIVATVWTGRLAVAELTAPVRGLVLAVWSGGVWTYAAASVAVAYAVYAAGRRNPARR